MTALPPDWVTSGLVDFEYKKYLLLAYLRDASRSFDEAKLYPVLADLVFHYRNLVQLREDSDRTAERFPQRLSKLDLEEFRLAYERMVEDDGCMDTIRQILDYAIPRMKEELGRGRALYEEAEGSLRIEPVGLVPIDLTVGYFFLRRTPEREARVYAYEISLFEHGDDAYRGIRTRELAPFTPSIAHTFEAHKLAFIQQRREWPNPATWLVSSSTALPLTETLLPVAKRSLVRHLALRDGDQAPQA